MLIWGDPPTEYQTGKGGRGEMGRVYGPKKEEGTDT